MRAVAQRVLRASVKVDDVVTGAIDHGLLVYLGAAVGDADADRDLMIEKLAGLRIFRDENDKMSRSVVDVAGAILVVPQFTLFGDVRKGRRPFFEGAAPPEDAERLYEAVCAGIRARNIVVAQGKFRANMLVESAVDGPITILIDSRKLF